MPKEWADKYKGQFDDGWDAYREKVFARQKELGHRARRTPSCRAHDPDVPDWDALSADERRLYARMMEVFAGFLEHTDHHIGRLLDFLDEIGELDNTLIMVDLRQRRQRRGRPDTARSTRPSSSTTCPSRWRRASQAIDELGGPKHFNHYPWGWTWAGNTPFRRWKRETYRGGVDRSVHRALAAGHQGQGRGPHQYAHIIDMVPDGARRARHRAAGRDPRRHAVADRRASASRTPSTTPRRRRRHHTQYFEMFGHRAIYHDGWRAVCPWPGPSFTEAGVGFGELDHHRGQAARARRQRAGSSTTSTRTSPRPRTSPPSTATS